jgi:hypothetical protein
MPDRIAVLLLARCGKAANCRWQEMAKAINIYLSEERIEMRQPDRVTISLDDETAELFQKVKRESKSSQSELMRAALKFYEKYRALHEAVNADKVSTYVELLAGGEHIVLDIDHWFLFLSFMESHPDKERFWELHRAICAAHAEEFKSKQCKAEQVLKRLEACNFFKVSEASAGAVTVVLGPEVTRRFVKTELEGILARMGFEVGIKEDLAKLRLKFHEPPH